MADDNGAAPAAGQGDHVADAPDDGLTPEERTQFTEMQQATTVARAPEQPAPEDPPLDAPVVDKPAADAAKATPGAEPDDADDEEDEPAAPAAGAKPGEKAPPRRIRYSKYKKETDALRQQIEASNKTVAEKDAMLARLDERLKVIDAALSTPQEQKAKTPPLPAAEDDPEPNAEEDLFAWVNWQKRDTARLRQQIAQRDQQTQQQTEAQGVEQQTQEIYINDAKAMAAKEPNFLPAYQFLLRGRQMELAQIFFGKDLTEEGTTLSPQEVTRINKAVLQEERVVVREALTARQSPAQRIFALAKARGFRPPPPQPDAGKPANGAATGEPPQLAAANGRAPANAAGNVAAAPAAAPAAQPNVREEIDRVKNGQDAALSLSNGGGAPSVTLDAKRLASMSDEEFGAMMDGMSDAEWKKIAGG